MKNLQILILSLGLITISSMPNTLITFSISFVIFIVLVSKILDMLKGGG